MEKYGALEKKIQALEAKFQKLDQRDISFAKYKEEKEKFKM